MITEIIKLPHLIEGWICEHPILRDHFIVIDRQIDDNEARFPTHYITYSCPNRYWTKHGDMGMRLYINNNGIKNWDRNLLELKALIVEDPKFFNKLEKLLVQMHESTG
jgi:hypothetical protein